MTDITPDLARDALSFIQASLPRDEWAKVGMAIKSEFPDDVGRDLFLSWSATADSFDAKDAASTWRSIKAVGGVTIATLIHLAQQNGFVLPKSNQASSQPDPQAAARRAAERDQAQKKADSDRKAAHEAAAQEAARQWAAASDTGTSAYLLRKRVPAHGLRFAADGMLLVPMRDKSGRLQNLQRIASQKPANGGSDKLFLPGGRKTGLFHWIGDPAGEPVLLVAEGYATGATCHQATNRPVAIAFDAGNLASVCKTIRSEYPAALIVVCGDDDKETEVRTGTNPGRSKATAAAAAVGGLAVFPEDLPPDGSDFNDLAQASGIEKVTLILDHGIDTFEPIAPTENTQGKSKSPKTPADKIGSRSTRQTEPSDATFDPFEIDDAGVWFFGADADGRRKPREWICSRLEVVAGTRDADNGSWGYLLEFRDPLNHLKTWSMPSRMLSGDGGEYRSTLLAMGLRIAPGTRPRNLLTQYIQTRVTDDFAVCVDRVGWHSGSFVLPRETIAGDDAERVVFQSESPVENTFRAKGSAEEWRDRVGRLCAGNSRLTFAVACAFAGPLLRPAGMESGGFHLRGDSSSGKTTALRLAASVYGGPNYLQRWRSTDNAIESTAAQHNDGLLILDELAQVEAKVAGEVAYLLANEQGKARATRNGTPRPRQTWRLLFLSAGELSLSDHMAEGMRRAREGQQVRMVDLVADAGKEMGAFEHLHGHLTPAGFAKYLTHQAQAVYGAPGRAWLQWLVANVDTIRQRIRTAADDLAQRIIPKDAAGQVERVGSRFALVGAAGELATAVRLTGWPAGESERAATACFNAWLSARGGDGNGEVVAMLRQVRRFLELHGEGRFSMWHRGTDDHAPKTLNRAGVRRMLGSDGEPIKTGPTYSNEFNDRMIDMADATFEYFILPDAFRLEVCQGFDPKAVCRVLLDHDCLLPGKDRAFDTKQRLPGMGPTWVYRIPPRIFELEL